MKILIIRRDNIGDLVCTTPLIAALRQRFPQAAIDFLVNSYNAPVVEGHPQVDRVFVYTKAKHAGGARARLGAYLDRLGLAWALRRRGYDWAILAGRTGVARMLRTARLAGAANIVGFARPGELRGLTHPIALPGQPEHEAAATLRLLSPLGIAGVAPPLSLAPRPAEREAFARQLAQCPGYRPGMPVVAFHVSARKPSQRWPAEHVAAMMRALHQREGCALLLFWSPGAPDHPQHPGDDDKAAAIVAACADLPLLPCPTERLEQLIGGLALADRVVCSDGGAMHLAAGLGKPILCFFGQSDARVWHPWQVPHVVLQPPSHDVGDVDVAMALEGWERLQGQGKSNSTS
ncbi:glycosyltransferase family 9 protein [Chitiniphilus shinanonensis]|uniref:glycosyltransferase family 9 protein n=1 Tax=Chitiniphilus shinanonensis TaxID=553088 RepID=UPI0030526C6F